MRIVSLLPSLTELVAALGHERELVGVTHECDHPAAVTALPHLTRSRIPTSASSASIDAMVADQGGQLYELDAARLESLRPDLILTQAQCDVCAVSEDSVRQIASRLPGSPHVESVNPLDLSGVFAMFLRIGDLLGARDEAKELVERFEASAAEIARRRAGRPIPRVLHLEWFDPPFISGHWNPELIALAGGAEAIGRPGEPSRRAGWDEVAAGRPEVVLLASCGFSLDRTDDELSILQSLRVWRDLPAVLAGRAYIIDGSAYFSRPGPRLEETLRIAAAMIDPETCGDLAPRAAWKQVPVLA